MPRTKADILGQVRKPYTSAKKVDNNTIYIEYEDKTKAVRLHDTDIVTFLPDGTQILSSGGWRTATTKDRINRFSNASVRQDKGIWYVGEENVPFYDGMTVDFNGQPIDASGATISASDIDIGLKAIEKTKASIKRYCDLITEKRLPVPNNGDCWYCLFTDKGGRTMGDLSSNDHLEKHLKEKYLHGSILVNAMRECGYSDDQIRIHYHMRIIGTFRRALRRYLTRRLLPQVASR